MRSISVFPAANSVNPWTTSRRLRSARLSGCSVILRRSHAAAGLLRPPVNMMRLGLHPRGFAPRVANLAQVRGHLLPRLARQAARSGDPELGALHDELMSYGPPPGDPQPDPAEIALPIHLEYRDARLCFINAVTTFGAAFDITLAEIAVETYLPADAATARFLAGEAATGGRAPRLSG
ncbi:MmyB family transcriptional regulator [Nocardia rhamnosiphila]